MAFKNYKGGLIIELLDRHLADIGQSVIDRRYPTKKAHSVTLKITLKAVDKDRNDIDMEYSIQTKKPQIRYRKVKFIKDVTEFGTFLNEKNAKGEYKGTKLTTNPPKETVEKLEQMTLEEIAEEE